MCAAMLGCRPHGEGPVVISDARLASAVAARRTPTLDFPDRPVNSIGRCAIEIGPRPPETGERVRAEFLARNGGWRVGPEDLNPALGIVRHALEPTDGSIHEPIAPVTDDEAVQLAFDFLARNFDLFGLSLSDLAHVQVNPGRQQDDKTMVMRRVQIDSDIPQPGYEQFASLARTWRASFALNRAGKLRAVHVAAQDLLPPIRLCTEPQLTAGDARLTEHVIGTRLSYSTIAGQRVDAGQVEASDIQSTKLTVHRAYDKDRSTTSLRLAYLVVVGRSGLSWSFVIDADTGNQLALYPNFVS